MPKAIVIRTDNTFEIQDFEPGKSYQLLQAGVEGLFDCVSIKQNLDLWLNDSGKIDRLPMNEIGTYLYRTRFKTEDYIAGNIVLTGGADEEGETLGIDDTELEQILSLIRLFNSQPAL
jgi:hypothetical protein